MEHATCTPICGTALCHVSSKQYVMLSSACRRVKGTRMLSNSVQSSEQPDPSVGSIACETCAAACMIYAYVYVPWYYRPLPLSPKSTIGLSGCVRAHLALAGVSASRSTRPQYYADALTVPLEPS